MHEPASASAHPPVGLVLGALGFGMLLGVGAQAVVTWSVRALQERGASAAPPSLTSGPALVLLLGTLAGIVAAGSATWVRLAPIRNPWRQGMLALIAGLSSFVLSLVTIPIDRSLGPAGLLALAALAWIGCFWIGRRRTPPAEGAAP